MWARSTLSEAAQSLISSKPTLKFRVYAEMDLAPVRIFRDDKQTYIQLREPTTSAWTHWNPEVSQEGPVDAASLKDAIFRLLNAFRGKDLKLQASFYTNGIVEITNEGAP
jgi:hypothetical protein